MGVLEATSFPAFPRRLRGRAARTGRGGLRGCARAVQRDDRPAAGADRAVRLDRRRGGGGPFRPGQRARGRGPRRRPRRGRAGALRRRAGDRSPPDERGHASIRRRASPSSAAAQRWAHLDRATEPHGLATTGGKGVDDRRRRLRARRRQRLARPQDGARLRQPRRRRGGDRRRPGADRLRRASIPTSSGRCTAAAATSGSSTSLSLPAAPARPVTVALLLWEPAEAGRVLRAYRDFVDGRPDDVGGGSVFLTAPPEAVRARGYAAGRLALGILLVIAGARGGGAGGDGADARARAPGRDDRRDALCRAAVPARRSAGLSATTGRPSTCGALPDAAIDAFVALGATA